jgi:hypothetical protein
VKLVSRWLPVPLIGLGLFTLAEGPRAASTTIIAKRVVADAPKVTRIGISDAGHLFVLTPDDHSVAVHDMAGAQVGRVGMVGNGPGELLNPVDIGPAPGDAVWVADKGNHRLQRFDAAGHANAQIALQSPLSVAVVGNGEVWAVAAFERPLFRIFDKSGAPVRDVGEPISLRDMPPEQEAYLSRGRIIPTPTGALYMFRSLATPKLLRFDAKGQQIGEIVVQSKALDAARQRAVQMEVDVKKNGGFRFSGTLNAAAVDSRNQVVWVCPSAAVLLAYDLNTGSPLGEFDMRLESANGEIIALQDMVIRGKEGYGVVAKRGVVKFDLPTVSKVTH